MARLKNKNKMLKNYISKKTISLFTILLLLTSLAPFAWRKYSFMSTASNEAAIVPLRDQILSAVGNLYLTAPVDAKTGDTYFPEANLYLPASHDKRLKYRYDKDGLSGQPELNVSSEIILGSMTSNLYSNTGGDIERLLEQVPGLQACARGYKLVYNELSDEAVENLKLLGTIKVNAERDIYVYLDSGCPEFEDENFSINFSGLRSY